MAGNGKSRRGFASMDPARQKEIASRGGRAAHAKGTAHEWSSDEARVAGRKGGEVVSRDREHMAAIGREGGEARGQNARLARSERSEESRSAAAGQGAPREREMSLKVSREGMDDHSRSDSPSADRGNASSDRSPSRHGSDAPRVGDESRP